jgi:hypothetical protein
LSPESEKLDKDLCVILFKKYFIDCFDQKDLIAKSYTGEIDKIFIRSTMWRIFVGALPNNQNYKNWVEVVNKQRSDYIMKYNQSNNKKLAGDPLGFDTKSVIN